MQKIPFLSCCCLFGWIRLTQQKYEIFTNPADITNKKSKERNESHILLKPSPNETSQVREIFIFHIQLNQDEMRYEKERK
jgi:hypothetical protein